MNNSSLQENWTDSFPGAITVCDTKGTITEMNNGAKEQFHKYGGEQLIGSNLLDCHPEPARSKLKDMLENQVKNIYITQTKDEKKLVIQTPLYQNGEYSGFIELSLKFSGEIPVLDRNK